MTFDSRRVDLRHRAEGTRRTVTVTSPINRGRLRANSKREAEPAAVSALGGRGPRIDPDAYVRPAATVIGDARIGAARACGRMWCCRGE